MRLIDYFYYCGKEDEKLNVNRKYQTIIDIYSLYYRLGRLSERFINSPTKLCLIEDLYLVFSQYKTLPSSTRISLKNHYSHRLLKKTMRLISYEVLSKKPVCSDFSVSRISRK